MPTHKVKGGYKWGNNGKIYPTKKQADKQGQAIYASGWNENKEYKKTNQKMKQVIRLTESDLHRMIKESVKKVLNENDFKPNGYKATSAFGGYEMQLDDRGEMARLRNSYTSKVSEWLEIQFDEDGVAYVIDENGDEERLCDYMRL